MYNPTAFQEDNIDKLVAFMQANSFATLFDMTDHSRVFNLILDAAEVDRLNTVFEKSRDLDRSIGYCADEDRR